jgi:hypothetical protein
LAFGVLVSDLGLRPSGFLTLVSQLGINSTPHGGLQVSEVQA